MKKNTDALFAVKIVVIMGVVLAVCVLGIMLLGYGCIEETTMLADYGKITGNFDNATPRRFVDSFFPKEIGADFSNVVYHYRAKKLDTYAYECYLEFVIDDHERYSDFVNEHINRSESTVFIHDESFFEQSVSNVFYLQSTTENMAAYPIEIAEIGKILYSDQLQRIIFVAIGVYDGGGTNTKELGYFFSRFQIDPLEYEKNAFASDYYQQLGITNIELRTEDGTLLDLQNLTPAGSASALPAILLRSLSSWCPKPGKNVWE